MIRNYKNTEFELYGYLIQIRELYRANNLDEVQIGKINEAIELIQSRRFNVAVMGEFKRGKSSLINAILGMKILPADVTPTTATINRITYGTEPSMVIQYLDGTSETADLNNISDYVTMLTEQGLKRASQIREAIVHYPTVICQNHVDIIDTPGLNDNADMTAVTMSMLNNIDAIIVVVSALSPFSEKEAGFIADLIHCDNVENMIFVVTHIDQLEEDEQDRMVEYIHQRIRKNVSELIRKQNNEMIFRKAANVLEDSLIFGVSSLLALKSFVNGDRELLKRSRFEVFKTELYEFLTAQQGTNVLLKAIRGIQSASLQFEELFKLKISLLEQALNELDINTARLGSFFNNYRRSFEELLQNADKQAREILMEVMRLKARFYENITGSLNMLQNSSQNDVMNTLITQAESSKIIANSEITASIKSQLSALFTSAVQGYCSLRSEEFLNPLHELRKVCDFQWQGAQCFDPDNTGILMPFGLPSFNWCISPVPNPAYFFSYNITDNIRYAVDISVQRFFENWNQLVNKIEGWLVQEADYEVSSMAAILNNKVKLFMEQKRNELVLLKNTYYQQLPVIQGMKGKAEAILSEMDAGPAENLENAM